MSCVLKEMPYKSIYILYPCSYINQTCLRLIEILLLSLLLDHGVCVVLVCSPSGPMNHEFCPLKGRKVNHWPKRKLLVDLESNRKKEKEHLESSAVFITGGINELHGVLVIKPKTRIHLSLKDLRMALPF